MSTITPTGDPRVATCAHCGTPLASDQRYCLGCGARRDQARLPFQDALAPATVLPPAGPPAPPAGPPPAVWYPPPPSGGVSTGTVLAALACVLVAFGVGLLVGRQGGDRDPVVIGGAVAPAAVAPTATTPDPTATTTEDAAAGAGADATDGGKAPDAGKATDDTGPAELPAEDRAAAEEVEQTSTKVPEAKPLSESTSKDLDSKDPDKAREASQSLPDVVSTGD